MSLPPLTLKDFVRSVPVCEQTNLASVLSLFQSGDHESIVVVSEHQSPLGVLDCRRLMPDLVERFVSPDSRWIAPTLSSDDLSSLVKPITIFPAQMQAKSWFYAQTEQGFTSASPYALVDPEEKFMGLLDSHSLLKSLLTHYTRQNSQVAQQPLQCRQPLLDLLEQLPVPIMLHTEEQTLQNSHWRKHLGDFRLSECSDSLTVNVLTNGEILSPQDVITRPLTQAEPDPFGEEIFAQDQERDLERIWQFLKLPLHFPDSPSPSWLVLATDITQQQQLCQELAAKNVDLAHLNRIKDEFLACVSHELKSPLTAIVGLSSLLKEQKLGELNQRQARYAKQIYNSGHQLMSLVNDLLDLTRLETDQLKLTFKPVQLEKVCQRAYALATEQQKTDHQLEFDLEIESDLTLLADERRLLQMLVHLLNNAFKFTQTEGEVGLKVNRWERWIAFTVWDTGIGIPTESQHLIFQKFQQLESPLTRQFEGTGLGLVLTQRLARAHHGDISFISRSGQGSQFTILLPPNPLEHEAHNQQQTSDQLVLIVEAIPYYIESLTDQLEALDFKVVVARSGTEALEKARQLQPHAILLDPLLPLLSGWDVLTLLKSNERSQKIPVLMMLTSDEPHNGQRWGADGVISLPVENQTLQEMLAHKGDRS